MERIGNELNVFLQKGASFEVDKLGAQLVTKHGHDILKSIAKLNFKNTEKINALLK